MMMPTRLLVVAVLLSLTAISTLAAREWIDSSGKYRIEAELVVVKDGKLYLEKTDGQPTDSDEEAKKGVICRNDSRLR